MPLENLWYHWCQNKRMHVYLSLEFEDCEWCGTTQEEAAKQRYKEPAMATKRVSAEEDK